MTSFGDKNKLVNRHHNQPVFHQKLKVSKGKSMSCCVWRCNARTENGRGKHTFFRLPSDRALFDQWQEAVTSVCLRFNSFQRICSEHFKPEEIITKSQRKYLQPGAVPSRNIIPLDHGKIKTSEKQLVDGSSLPSGAIEATMQPSEDGSSMRRTIIEKSEMVLIIETPKDVDFKIVESNILPRKLTFNEKVAILLEYEKSKETYHLPTLFHCHKSQVMKTLRSKQEICKRLMRVGIASGNPPCPMQHVVSIVVYEFLQRCSNRSILITDFIIQKMARSVASMLQLRGFTGSDLWLGGFLRRYRLTGINWSSWSKPCEENQKSLDLRTIIEELRLIHGPLVIPYPEAINFRYGTILAEMLASTFDQLSSNTIQIECTSKSETEKEIIVIPDDMLPAAPQTPNDPSCTEKVPEVWPIDPMTIDSYQTALSYFRPLEEFLLSKRDPQTVSIVNQLGKVLLKAAEAETQEPVKEEVVDVIPYILNEVQIDEYEDALQYLKRLDEFLLDNEDMRAVGLINQLEVNLRSK